MSTKFFAVHRESGERWQSRSDKKQYLIMYDSGGIGVVTEDFYTYIQPLGPEWKPVFKKNIINYVAKFIDILEVE